MNKNGAKSPKTISIRADAALYEKVRLAAYQDHRSMGGWIRNLLIKEFENTSPALDSEGVGNVEATVSGS